MKRISLILMVALLCIMLTLGFTLLSCKTAKEATETTTAAQAANAGKKVTLGVVLMDTVNPSWVTLMAGGDIAGKEVNAEVIWKGSENSLEKEIANVENFIQQKVGCILVDPMDKVAMAPVLEKALKAGIPTVSMGNLVKVPGNVSTVYNDYNDTYNLNKILFYYLNSEGKVIYLLGQNGNYCSDMRQSGFDAVAKEFPNIQVLVKGPGGFDPVAGQKLMEDYLTKYPEISAVSIWNDGLTAAIATAIKNSGRNDIVITGFDADPTTIKMMDPGGMMVGNVMTGLKRIGAWNVKVGAALARGAELDVDKEGKLFLPTKLILTQAVVDKAKANGWKDDGVQWLTPADSMVTIENATVDWSYK